MCSPLLVKYRSVKMLLSLLTILKLLLFYLFNGDLTLIDGNRDPRRCVCVGGGGGNYYITLYTITTRLNLR